VVGILPKGDKIRNGGNRGTEEPKVVKNVIANVEGNLSRVRQRAGGYVRCFIHESVGSSEWGDVFGLLADGDDLWETEPREGCATEEAEERRPLKVTKITTGIVVAELTRTRPKVVSRRA